MSMIDREVARRKSTASYQERPTIGGGRPYDRGHGCPCGVCRCDHEGDDDLRQAMIDLERGSTLIYANGEHVIMNHDPGDEDVSARATRR